MAAGKLWVVLLAVRAAAEPEASTAGKFAPNPWTSAEEARARVVAAMQHTWTGYEKYAWGHDELQPLTKDFNDNFGLGLTIVDSMDTLWIMGLKKEFEKGRDWIRDSMNIKHNRRVVSVFETTIRALGGLLSAYEMSGDQALLAKAKELGEQLYGAYNPSSGVFQPQVQLSTGHGHYGSTNVAEAGTLLMENVALSRHTGDAKFGKAAHAVFDKLHDQVVHKFKGMVPIDMEVDTAQLTGSHVSWSGAGDSFYEYMLKGWLQTGKTDTTLREMYDASVEAMQSQLVKQSKQTDSRAFVIEKNGRHEIATMGHLVCFLPGVLVLGAEGQREKKDLHLAAQLTDTCYEMYHKQPTGLSPDDVKVLSLEGQNKPDSTALDMFSSHANNIQRPEAAEALMYLWRKTHDQKYRDWGWNMMQAFDQFEKVPSGGYSGVQNVGDPNGPKDNQMQTFWPAETLKYLYLLFSDDDVVPLDKYVFNTEAHPFEIFSTKSQQHTEASAPAAKPLSNLERESSVDSLQDLSNDIETLLVEQ